MKAFLLAAGMGTRLRPLTDRTPKCLLPIDGTPLLALWLERMGRAGIDDVLVNTHHLAGEVESFARARSGPPRLTLVHEATLLGSAGTLAANRAFADDGRPFVTAYADNLTNVDLAALIARHEASGLLATLGLFRSPKPESCGIVELDADGVITAFTEKPARPRSDLANAGIYVFSPEVFDLIENGPVRDIGFHLLPRLVGRSQGFLIEGYMRDIGTLDAYERAQVEWKGLAS
jgi:mannose-1-phosphate guanylyltransferase